MSEIRFNEYTQNTKNIWFPDQIEPIYDEDDPEVMEEFNSYWGREFSRLKDGFNLGGYFVSGWLYWHTVYFKIEMYVEIVDHLGKTRKVRLVETPYLRDLEIDIANDFVRCEEEGKFYILVGSRDFGKSIIAASRGAWLYTMFDKSETVISGGAKDYIKLATDKIEDGLVNIHPLLKKQRIASNWDKEVRAGWKDKKTNQPSEKSSNSKILIRNYEMGNKTMAANGTRPGFHLIDEIGTIPNLISCVKDSDGCWRSGGGSGKPSCLVMLAGTGGDMEVGAEAAEIFYTPEAYDMISFDNHWEPGGKKIGRFIPATRAKLKYKEPQPLSSYLGIDHPELARINVLVSNEEKAKTEWWDVEYAKALKSGNQKTVVKFKAYWPLVPGDSFIVLTKNDFNTEAARAQQAKIRNLELQGRGVELYHDGNKICHRFVDKLPISEFPLKTQSKDAPIQVWEFPIDEKPPFGLYTAGVDPYRHSLSEGSDSLGAVYIFKRIHDIQSQKYQNIFVAAYVARPENKDKWNETARMLIKYYNAYALVENDEYSFIDYMVRKGDSQYLSPQPDFIKDWAPNSTVRREYGIHRSSERIRAHLDGSLKSYLDEVIYQETDDNGSVISETLGVTRVFDTMLLEEIIKFNADGNFDRVVAAQLAVVLADHLNPQFKVTSEQADPRLQAYFNVGKQSRTRSVIEIKQKTMDTRPRRSKLFL